MSAIVNQLRANVSGRVQGVSYRYYTRREAVTLGLTGWVRNEPDGSVVVVAEGDIAKLERLLTYLHYGPPAAIVERVSADWSKGPSEFGEFEIRWL
jgi:acylphosphatase